MTRSKWHSYAMGLWAILSLAQCERRVHIGQKRVLVEHNQHLLGGIPEHPFAPGADPAYFYVWCVLPRRSASSRCNLQPCPDSMHDA